VVTPILLWELLSHFGVSGGPWCQFIMFIGSEKKHAMITQMMWTIEYFNHQSSRWLNHYEVINPIMQPRHAAYATQLVQMWLAFADHAKVTFHPLLAHDQFTS